MKTKAPSPGTERGEKIKNVIRVSSGNFLEMYDFIVFGYYAAPIGRTFFPGHNPYASLMLSLMTFAAGFLMRPVGAIVLGDFRSKRTAPRFRRGPHRDLVRGIV
jgi:hypothetical protein